VPGGDRRQVGQGEARQRTGCRSRLPWRGQDLGLLASIGCRRAPGLPLAWPVLAVLDHRQFGRAFVLSIGEAGHEATTAPVSSGAGWRSPANGARSKARQRTGCRSGLPWRGQDVGLLAVLDRRQFGRSFVLSIGEAGHEATTAPGGDRRQAVPGRTRDSAPAADRSCRGLVRLSGCLQASVADVRQGCRRRGSCWQCSITGSSVGPSSSRSVKPATKRRRRQCRAVPGGDRRQVVPGRRRDSVPGADRGCRGVGRISGCLQASVADVRQGCRRRGSCWQRSITGSSVGLSSSRSVKPATKRRRRQCRAVPGGDHRQVGQVEGETAYRLPIGVAVACGRGVGVLAALDHRQFGRAFVLSIGEAGHEATTAPVSSGAGWRSPASGPGRRRDSVPAADRGCRGVGRMSGCWQCSIAGSSVGPSSSRLVKPPTRRQRRQRRAVPGGEGGTAYRLPIGVAVACGCGVGVLAALDHRQFGRSFVLSIGEAGHEATTALGLNGAWWRSPASGQGRTRDSVPAADRGCRGLWSWCRGAGSARPSAVRSGFRPLDW
jgi:hypothetical protein